jgi:hypothetical protein
MLLGAALQCKADSLCQHGRCLPLLRSGLDLGVIPAEHDATREFAEVTARAAAKQH